MEFIRETNRIYAEDATGRLIAEVSFPQLSPDTVNIDHTFVDDTLRGQGVAGQLMQTVYETLKADGRRAALNCAYAVKWYAAHPEKNDVIAAVAPTR
ncbi:MAG: N-acetyltransferase [Zoogloeaceae bacterium]|jgi:predicted GNAT family acetyltransferase|nr:N-acetyltransferase [Zoogloeaceae bacterium]